MTPQLSNSQAFIVFRYSAPGQSGLCENTFVAGNADASPFVQANLDDLVTFWGDNVMPSLDAQVVFLGGTATTFLGGMLSVSVSIPGDGSATMIPLIAAVLVRKLTGVGGISNRGRWFIPGPDTANINQDGTFDAGYLANFQAGVTGFLNDAAGAGIDLFVGHPAAAATLIEALDVVNLISTQRARLRN